jgi:hypothetical protein
MLGMDRNEKFEPENDELFEHHRIQVDSRAASNED